MTWVYSENPRWIVVRSNTLARPSNLDHAANNRWLAEPVDGYFFVSGIRKLGSVRTITRGFSVRKRAAIRASLMLSKLRSGDDVVSGPRQERSDSFALPSSLMCLKRQRNTTLLRLFVHDHRSSLSRIKVICTRSRNLVEKWL